MIALYTDRRMIDHRTPAGHPEKPERLSALLDAWQAEPFASLFHKADFSPVLRADLLRVHAEDYLNDVETESHRATDQKPVMLDPDTFLAKSSMIAAQIAAGAAVAAVEQVMSANPKDSQPNRAFCAIRPPGHHARPKTAMGFCIYGSIAVAAAHARDVLGLNRILIVDFDVHHGNGTQEMFYEDDRVGFMSIHRFPFYPGTGRAEETGAGRGLGYTWNVPLNASTRPEQYLEAFEKTLEKAASKMRPELVMISAGFDAHRLDPVGGLGLDSHHFTAITQKIVDVANHHCSGRIVSLLEGGYNVEKLVESASFHVKCLAGLSVTNEKK